MDFLTSNSMLLMEKSANFLWTKQAAILDNMANVETPNYKAKVVTFEESIRDRLRAAAQNKDVRFHPDRLRHLGGVRPFEAVLHVISSLSMKKWRQKPPGKS